MSENYLKNLFNLDGKVAVVTGGLGILGSQYVETLAVNGVKVAVLDIKKPAIDHGLGEFAKEHAVSFYEVNIADRIAVEKVCKAIEEAWGVPSILVNNAALDFPPDKVGEKFEDYPISKWNAVFEVNLTGMLICSQVFGGLMAQNDGGSIINISSTYGIVSPDQRIYDNFIKPVSYSVTKSGVLNLTRYLATYWAEQKVRVNTLSPGGVFNGQDVGFVQKYSQRVPLGRMAQKNEYNGAVLFLASDASSYMTGSNLVVDGGWTAW